MAVHITLNKSAIHAISKAMRDSAYAAADHVMRDLQESDTMPRDQGEFQNNQTFVDDCSTDTRICVRIVHSPVYSRFLYYGVKMVDSETGKGAFPIYDATGSMIGFRFRKGSKLKPTNEPLNYKNKNATPQWFEPYITGGKKDLFRNKYEEILRTKI